MQSIVVGTVGQLKTDNINFICEIDNFSTRCKKVGECIDSPIISPGKAIGKNKSQWKLFLYPYGFSEDSGNSVSCYLRKVQDELKIEVKACFKLSILNKMKEEENVKVSGSFLYKNGKLYGFINFIARDILLNSNDSLLTQDKLTVLCVINLNPYSFHRLKKEHELKHNLVSLFSNVTHSDVTISVDGKRLNAHKNILAARSTVFSAMLTHNMTESITNIITITDISYDVMKEVLRFIYTGTVDN